MPQNRLLTEFLILCALFGGLYLLNLSLQDSEEVDPTHQSPPSGMFTSPTCLESCWNELKIGQATEADFEQFASQNQSTLIQPGRPHINPDGQITYLFQYYDRNSLIMIFEEGVLNQITLSGDVDLTLRIIFQYIGIPDYISAINNITFNNGNYYGTLDLYYPQAGYIFSIRVNHIRREADRFRICLAQNDGVKWVTILESGTLATMLESIEILDGDLTIDESTNDQIDHLSEWRGFDCFYQNVNMD